MRRRRSRRLIPFVLLVLAGAHPALGQDVPEQGGAAFLLLPVGGRATALGQAGTTAGGSGEAVFWNPAGLARMPGSEFAIHYSETFVSNNSAITAFFVNERLGVLGAAVYLVDYGSQDVVPPGLDQPPTTGRSLQKNVALLASYAIPAGRVAMGVTYKLVQFRQDCQGDCGVLRSIVGTTHAIDVGLQVALGPPDALTLGVALRHAGFALQLENRDQADPLPTRLQVGAAYRIEFKTVRSPQPIDVRVLVDLHERWRDLGSPEVRVGLDMGYGQLIRARAGYAWLDGDAGGPAIGLGVRIDRIGVDIARTFFTAGTFEDPVYVSLRVLF
ncbi:MAG TPA: PorV/PorQ family protein [Gemmatimonadales bacterium]